MKQCVKCLQEKEDYLFPKGRKKCKSCRNEENKITKNKKRDFYIEYNKIKSREYKLNNKEKVKEYSKVYGPEYHKRTYKEFYAKNREDVIRRNYDYSVKKMKTDPFYKLKKNLRTLIANALRRKFTKKSKKTIEILGCSFKEFKLYLESKFDQNMTWENQSTYWHIDHIIPVSWAKDEEELIKLNHYTNLQPLHKDENMEKGNKYTTKDGKRQSRSDWESQ